jgi:hypothetical protein
MKKEFPMAYLSCCINAVREADGTCAGILVTVEAAVRAVLFI